jgi:broad specificity phosphatase PhoE
MSQNWPEKLWVIRHGQSEGNVARDAAVEAGLHRIALGRRDVDIPHSQSGEEQARALGHWFAASGEKPDILLASPYVRAVQTAHIFRDSGGVRRSHTGDRLWSDRTRSDPAFVGAWISRPGDPTKSARKIAKGHKFLPCRVSER